VNTLVLYEVEPAAEIIRCGGVVAFPTETVFGLGADATNPQAIAKLFEAKGRPSDNPLIVHLSEVANWSQAARALPPVAEQLLHRFAPGPLTVVLPKQPSICDAVTAGLETVGVRIPAHSLARHLLAACKVPVAAPSANRSSLPSGTTWQTVLEDLDGLIDAVLCGQIACEFGIESTVVDCTSQPPRILRPGAISLADLQTVAPEIERLQPGATTGNSPGLRHAHYQPKALLRLVDNSEQLELMLSHQIPATERERRLAVMAYCGLDRCRWADQFGLAQQFATAEEYARQFYEFLRSADRLGIRQIYCQKVPNSGIGLALNDRMERAAKAL
jgi:L-threonylcarbamoyladenylate synthase